jgi:HAD superfamily hydrolase (TIGR01549 family)
VGEPGAVTGMDEAGILETIQALDAHGKTERTLFCQQLLQAFPALPYSPESLWQAHQVLPQFVQADDALLALLPRLAQHYQLMILSNGSGSMQRQKLHQAHLSAFFDPIFISGEVGYAKPDARLFAHARRACDHELIVMIGDDYHNDMAPALALGWQTIFINPRQQSLSFQAALKPQRELVNIYALEEALACMI